MFVQPCNLIIIRYVKLLHHKMAILDRQVGPLKCLPTYRLRTRTDTHREKVCVFNNTVHGNHEDTSNHTIPSAETLNRLSYLRYLDKLNKTAFLLSMDTQGERGLSLASRWPVLSKEHYFKSMDDYGQTGPDKEIDDHDIPCDVCKWAYDKDENVRN